MADVQIDVLGAARTGAHELAKQIADLTLELAAQRALVQAQQARIADLEASTEKAD